ncbi:MAG: hypothetical protein KJ907_02590 [Actinobacteria bacterium]|nr:hypothetical protein [Actinomycetota bacterium]MBU4401610.1 hypothetical protein [Actinomycetota bacterium]MBU4441860.1 hypothetical protein [Actinomycetota bacterium]
MAVALGIVALLVIVAVVLILVLVVFKGGPGPEEVAREFYRAVEEKDMDAMIALMDRESFQGNPELEKVFREEYFKGVSGDVKINGLELEAKVSGDKATVEATAGTATYVLEGSRETDQLSEENPLEMVKTGGGWYIDPTSFADICAVAYINKGNEITDSAVAISDQVIGAFDSFTSFMNSSPYMSPSQQVRGHLNAIAPLAGSMKAEAEKAKPEYQKVMNLEGEYLGGYKEYANLAIEYLERGIQWADKLVETVGYSVNSAAAVESGQPFDYNAFNGTSDALYKQVTDLQQGLSDTLDKMNELRNRLNE